MRLDHLLSTEFSGRRSGVRRVAHMPGTVPGVVWACWCGRDRWLRGFRWGPAGSGMGMLLGSRTATRDLVACGFPDVPLGGRPAGVPCPDRCLGAWWFENWIVDASNAMMIFCHRLLYRDFARLYFLESGFEIDRFVIIFYSVMICRLA